uniref:Probable RNA-binding protein EIF1AD n=1 Tax=Plectus sambesii TaxID=2011161 RepID=A0A914XHG0_9BILA
MSVATKRRLVTRELNKGEVILPGEHELIAQIVAPKGNNLHEVEDQHGHTYLASMPNKFRKSAWIKRGDFVFVQPIEEGDKVRAEITHILYPENIAYIKEQHHWPISFSQEKNSTNEEEDGAKGGHQMIDADMLPPSDSDSDSDGGQVSYNPNRQDAAAVHDEDEDSSSGDEEDEGKKS